MSLLDKVNKNIADKDNCDHSVESMSKMIKSGISDYVRSKYIFNSNWYGPNGFKQPSRNSKSPSF